MAAKDCEAGATNMAEVRACLGNDAEESLEKTYEETLRYIRGKDPEAARLLAKAQKSWRTFLDDSCAYTVAARQTDIMSNDARSGCFVAFVQARINILKSYKRSFGKENLCKGDPC